MTKFFESELIREELQEINDLQKSIYGSILSFGSMDRENKLEHIDKLTQLLEKQRIMYTRLSLSGDPQAIEMKESLKKSVAIMGFSSDTDINVLFNSMSKTIEAFKKFLN
jgi:hypothetical protein